MNGDLYPLTLRIEIPNKKGMLGLVAGSIGANGGNIGAIDTVSINKDAVVRDITIAVSAQGESQKIIESLRKINGVKIKQVSNPILLAHLRGKIRIEAARPIKDRTDLSYMYTPGVAQVCRDIYEDPRKVWNLTIKGNAIAIITDGSRVLGLGNIGPEASLPVMEGKAMIFKIFANIDAFPLPLATQDTQEIIKTVKYISPVFGGINLEDIASPRCFEVEESLAKELDIPVFHDDQHGTAIVALAGLLNALKLVGKKLESARIVINGAGAAGAATARLLSFAGAGNIVGCDRVGIIGRNRKERMHFTKEWIARNTNPELLEGDLGTALSGADVFIGLSGPNILTTSMIQNMGRDPIIFALANPVSEIDPNEAVKVAAVVATGRSDFPNQINNALCFPGFFRGLLDSRVKQVTDAMKLAAAQALAALVKPNQLSEEYIIPSIFDKRRVVPAIANAVIRSAKT